ncbi:MAG: transmission trait enhancer LetE [Tatlockia sp.]|nr:transmission trait enhancer LetE [Tatlockia sp.]
MNDTTELLSHIKLRFNIDHPNFEECYSYGYECASAEIAEEENPYPEGSLEFEQWQDGWWAGFYGEQPAFSQTEEEPANFQEEAANDQAYPFISNLVNSSVLANILKITGAIAATAVVGYQVIELVA